MAYRKRESARSKAHFNRNAQKVNLQNVVKKHPRGGRCL